MTCWTAKQSRDCVRTIELPHSDVNKVYLLQTGRNGLGKKQWFRGKYTEKCNVILRTVLWRHNEGDGVANRVSIVCSIVCSCADQRKQQVPRHWPLWGEFTGDRWIPRTKGQWSGKCFHLMTSSWNGLWFYSVFFSWLIFESFFLQSISSLVLWHTSPPVPMKQAWRIWANIS